MKHYTKALTILFTALLSCSTYAADTDRLVLVSASYGKNIVAICDAAGNSIWEYKTEGKAEGHDGHHDVQLLPNGNILFHDTWTHMLEITLDKEIVWEYDSAKQNATGPVSVHSFTRLENGDTMIVESDRGRIIHVDKAGKLLKEFPLKKGAQQTRWARMTDAGGYVVASEDFGIVHYDKDGHIVWECPLGGRVYGARELKNGNVFICAGGDKRILEMNPTGHSVVWEVSDKVPGTDIELGWMTCIQESQAGNYLIGNCHAGPNNPQIFEINKDKKIVWQFDNFELVGNGLACWEVIEGERAALLRKQLAAVK